MERFGKFSFDIIHQAADLLYTTNTELQDPHFILSLFLFHFS